MDISKYKKADVLAALFNNARTQGMGMLNYQNRNMTSDEAQKILDGGQTYFDYYEGRVMKIDLSGNELRTGLYNRDNGTDAAENIINGLST